METRIVNSARLALALAAVLLFGLTAAARADGVRPPGPASAGEAPAATATNVAELGASNGPAATRGARSGTDASAASGETATSNAPSDSAPGVATNTAAQDAVSAERSGAPSVPDVNRIAQAVQEAISQASSTPPTQRSDGGEAETLAAESNATSQLAWQVQISQCTAHCVGTRQSQVAQQQNTTLQVVGQALARSSGDVTLAANAPSGASSEVRQFQIGCLAHCFGATTTSAASTLAAYGQALEALLRELASGLARLSPRPAVYTGAVEQTSYQSQIGAGEGPAQSQSLTQISDNTQLQGTDTASRATLSASEANELFNQTAQGIWQLQIGCLMFCQETTQYQQAEQSNSTTQSVFSSPASAASASGAAADIATQLIWQLQIGCLLWCYDANERQLASAHNTSLRQPGGGSPSPQPVAAASPSPVAGDPPIARAEGTSSPPPPGNVAQNAVGAPAVVAQALPAAGLPTSQPLPRRGRNARPVAVVGQPAAELVISAGSTARTGGPKLWHAVATTPRAVAGSTAAGAGVASGSNLAGVAVAGVIALFGLCVLCVALFVTTRRPFAA
jgi:hypothetical protein